MKSMIVIVSHLLLGLVPAWAQTPGDPPPDSVAQADGQGQDSSQAMQVEAKDESATRVAKDSAEGGSPYSLDKVTVTATGVQAKYRHFVGTANAVTKKEIEDWKPLSSQELLKKVPGVTALEEDPAGLRPSIGIRGLDPSRSRGGVVLLIDGIPFNPGPYSDPGAYYNVPIQRIDHIEIVKGGSSILYGPNAVGGVVNYITKAPPKKPELWTRQTVGKDALWVNEIAYGGAWGKSSGMLNYSRRTGDGFRDNSAFEAQDLSAKLKIKTGEGSDVAVNLNGYLEDSRTPRGMSPAQFEQGVSGTLFPHDQFKGNRVSADLVANHNLSDGQDLRLLVYFTAFERNWYLAGNSAFYNTSTLGAFKRYFNTMGLEPQYSAAYKLFGKSNELLAGARIMLERENENLVETPGLEDLQGTTFSTSEIKALGEAVYVQNAFHPTDYWTITPGARVEYVYEERDNNLINKNLQDLNANGPLGGTSGNNEWWQVLPGIGTSIDLGAAVTLHGGAWRSQSIPEFGSGAEGIDKVSGVVRRLDPEIGMTYEFGTRATPWKWLSLDHTLFLLDYEGQIGKVNNVYGNNVDTRSIGLENLISVSPFRGWNTYLNWTFLNSEFTRGPNKGKRTPNAAAHTLSVGLDYSMNWGRASSLSLGLSGLYVGERFSDAANTEAENAAGTVGKLEDYSTWDARVSYHERRFGLEAFGGMRNLLDEKYRLWRFGGGIAPGADRSVYAGLSKSFGGGS